MTRESLADPSELSVVAMNVDTACSWARLDLRSGPVLLADHMGATAGALTGPRPRSCENRTVNSQLPPWPEQPPAHGGVLLREFRDADAHLAAELGDDPYIPLIGSVPAHPDAEEALAWIARQRGRLAEGLGLSFAIADARTDVALGAIGLWLQNLASGRATIGYAVSPAHRGHGVARSALLAITEFAWTVPEVHRIELYIEPWNLPSIGVAAAAGFLQEGLLRSHQLIGDSRRDMLLYATTRRGTRPTRGPETPDAPAVRTGSCCGRLSSMRRRRPSPRRGISGRQRC